MIKLDIVAEKTNATYSIPFQIGRKLFSMQFDTGAAYTVISADLFEDNISADRKEQIKAYLTERNVRRKRFTSASGDEFSGYLVHAKNVFADDQSLTDFYYFLVIENKRVIALLGDDFIDHCEFHHDVHGDIRVQAFDDDGYGERSDFIENEDLINFFSSM